MLGVADAPAVVTGDGSILPATAPAGPVRFELRVADFTITLGGQGITANYRDVMTIAVDGGRVLLDVGGQRLLAERLGAGLGTLVGTMRDRRARQLLADRLIDLPTRDALELVEYQSAEEHGVAQLAYHPWGFALMPLDERRPWRLIRRADISNVVADQSRGRIAIAVTGRPGAPDARPIELLGLGMAAERERGRINGLRETALSDAAGIVGRLIPDAAAVDLARAGRLLVDGRPSAPAELGSAWPSMERAVVTDPVYAETYAALRQRSRDGLTWISLAPVRPGDPAEHMCWFFVSLPGDLVAFELVSEGSHATYLFRAGRAPSQAVLDVSESLIDTRFLREPLYMTDADLGAADNQRYRFAIAALPSLRAARSRFVKRLIHNDGESWATALDDAIKTEGA